MPSDQPGVAVGSASPSTSHRTSARWAGWKAKFGGSSSARSTPVLDDGGAWDEPTRTAARNSSIASSPQMGPRRRPSDTFLAAAQPGLASPQVSADRTSYGSSSGGAGGLSDGASSALTYPSPSSARSDIKPIHRTSSIIAAADLRYPAHRAPSTDEEDEAVTPGEGISGSATASRRGSVMGEDGFTSPPRAFASHPYAFASSPSTSTLAQTHPQDPSPVAPLASDRAKGRPYGFYPGVDPASPSADKGSTSRAAARMSGSTANSFASPSAPMQSCFETSADTAPNLSPASSSRRRFGRFGAGAGGVAQGPPSSATSSRRPSTTSMAQTPTLGGTSSTTPPLANDGWSRRPSTGDASWIADRSSRTHSSANGLVSGLRRLMSSQGNNSSPRSPSPPGRPHVHDEVQIVGRSRRSQDLNAAAAASAMAPPPGSGSAVTSLNEGDLQAYLAERSQANRRDGALRPTKAAELLGLHEAEHSATPAPKAAASSRSLASAFRRPSLPGYSGSGGVPPDTSPRTSFSPPWGGSSGSHAQSHGRPASASGSASMRMFAMGSGPRTTSSRSSLLGSSIEHVSHEEAKRRSGLGGPVVLTLGPAASASAGGRHRRQHSHSSALTTGSRHESIEELEAGAPPARPRRSDEGPPRPTSAKSVALSEGGAYGEVAESFNAAHSQRWSGVAGARTRKDSGQSVLSARLLGRRPSSDIQIGGPGSAQGHAFPPASSASSSSRASVIDVRSSPRFSFAGLDPNLRRRPSVATIGGDAGAAAADETGRRRSIVSASPSSRWSGLFNLPKKMTTSSISRPMSAQQPGSSQAAPMSDDDFILGSSSVDYRGPNRQPESGALGLAPSPMPPPSEPLSPTSAFFARAQASRTPEREPMELLPAWPESQSSVRHRHQHSVPSFHPQQPPPPPLQANMRQRMRTESEGSRARDWPSMDPHFPRAAHTARAPLTLADAALRSPRAATSRLAQAPMTASTSMSSSASPAASRPSSSYSDFASHSRRPTFGLDLQPDAAAAFDSIPSPHPAIARLRPESLVSEPTHGGDARLIHHRRPSLQPSDLSSPSAGPTPLALVTAGGSIFDSLRSAAPTTASSPQSKPSPTPAIEVLDGISPDVQPRPIPEEMPRSPEPRDGTSDMFIDGMDGGIFFSSASIAGSQLSTPALGTSSSATASAGSSPLILDRSQPASLSRAAALGLGLSLDAGVQSTHTVAADAVRQSPNAGVPARRRGSSSATARVGVPPSSSAALAAVATASPDRRAYAFV